MFNLLQFLFGGLAKTNNVVRPAPVTPAVVNDPIAPVVPTVTSGTKVKIEKSVRGRKWQEAKIGEGSPMYFYGSGEFSKSRLAAGKTHTYMQGKITVLEGQLTITDIATGGVNNPEIIGLKTNQVIKAGETVNIKFTISGPPETRSSGRQANFGIWTKELGQICKSTALIVG